MCGGAYRQNLWAELIIKNPRRYEQHIYETVCHMTNVTKFEVIFVGFRLMKNIIFNKTESFVGRNTSDHACQIFCSKSNCETVSLIFSPWNNRGQNNEQSECLLCPQLFIPTVPVWSMNDSQNAGKLPKNTTKEAPFIGRVWSLTVGWVSEWVIVV